MDTNPKSLSLRYI